MTGHITAIFVAPTKHAEQIAVDAVQLKTGKGIVGDRFFGLRKKHPGQNLTLIESEVIAEFNRLYQQTIPISGTRRNIVTTAIRLNGLVGKTFRVGDVLCRGVELCEPCQVLASQLSPYSLSKREVITAFSGKGGLRAEVLSNGIVRLGDCVLSMDQNADM